MCQVAHIPLRARALNALLDLILALCREGIFNYLHFRNQLKLYKTKEDKILNICDKIKELKRETSVSTETRANYINCQLFNKLLAWKPKKKMRKFYVDRKVMDQIKIKGEVRIRIECKTYIEQLGKRQGAMGYNKGDYNRKHRPSNNGIVALKPRRTKNESRTKWRMVAGTGSTGGQEEGCGWHTWVPP